MRAGIMFLCVCTKPYRYPSANLIQRDNNKNNCLANNDLINGMLYCHLKGLVELEQAHIENKKVQA